MTMTGENPHCAQNPFRGRAGVMSVIAWYQQLTQCTTIVRMRQIWKFYGSQFDLVIALAGLIAILCGCCGLFLCAPRWMTLLPGHWTLRFFWRLLLAP